LEIEELQGVVDSMDGNGAMIGLCLVNDDGTPVFTRGESETAQEFGKRVLAETDMEIAVVMLLVEKITNASKEPADFGKLAKNS
jgi:hypothetical protein